MWSKWSAVSLALIMTGVAIALTAVLVPPASAQTLAAPEAVEAQSP